VLITSYRKGDKSPEITLILKRIREIYPKTGARPAFNEIWWAGRLCALGQDQESRASPCSIISVDHACISPLLPGHLKIRYGASCDRNVSKHGGSFMEHGRLGNTDLMVSIVGLGCYGMSGAYGPADDAESIATIRRALDLGVNFLDTSASYGKGHNHRLIGEAIRGRRHEVVIHSKSGSPRNGDSDAIRGGGDPGYLRQTCEQSLKHLGIETLDVFCMSRVDPNVPIEKSVAAMAELVKEGKTRFISLSECSAESLRRGSAVHPLASL
jgi:hypothetical protein